MIPGGVFAANNGSKEKPVEEVLVECEFGMSRISTEERVEKYFRGTVASSAEHAVIDESFDVEGFQMPKVRIFVSYIPERDNKSPYRYLAVNLGFGNNWGEYPGASATSAMVLHHRKESLVLYRPTYIHPDIKGVSVSCEVKPLNTL